MLEIAGQSPLIHQPYSAQAAVRQPVTRVAAPASGSAAGNATDGRAAEDAAQRQGRAPSQPDPRQSPPDRFTLAGPTPAFQASLLEIEAGFKNALARLEAARAKSEADRAFGAQPRTQPGDTTNAPDAAEATAVEAEPDTATPPADVFAAVSAADAPAAPNTGDAVSAVTAGD
jgi:hypothetical protein